MKKLLLLGLLVALQAHAESGWILKKDNGEVTHVTLESGPICKPTDFYIWTTAVPSGKLLEGCWDVMPGTVGLIRVVWQDGSKYVFDLTKLTSVKERK